MKEDPFPDLKGNNSCKTYNFRIKAGKISTPTTPLAILAKYQILL
jgi:hypothetical protein